MFKCFTSEKEIFFGDIIPWIFGLHNNSENIKGLERDQNNIGMLKCVWAIKRAFSKTFARFYNIMKLNDNAKDCIIAVCHSKWKLCWIPENLRETLSWNLLKIQ